MNFLQSIIADARPRQTAYGQPDGLNTMDGAMAGWEFHGPDSHALQKESDFPTASEQSNRVKRIASSHDSSNSHHESGFPGALHPDDDTAASYSAEMEAGDLPVADTPEPVKGEEDPAQQDGVHLSTVILNDDIEKRAASDGGVDSYSAAAVDSDDGNGPVNRQADNLSATTQETPNTENPASAHEGNGTVEAMVGAIGGDIGKKAAENGEDSAGMKVGTGDPIDHNGLPDADDRGSGEGTDHPHPQSSGDDSQAFSVQAKGTHGMVEPSIQSSSPTGENRGVASTILAVSTSEDPPSDSDAGNHSIGRQGHDPSVVTQETPNAENPASAHEGSGTVESKVGAIVGDIGKKAAENGQDFAGMEVGTGDSVDHKVMSGTDDGESAEGANYHHSQRLDDGLQILPSHSKAARGRDESPIQSNSQTGEGTGSASAVHAVPTAESQLSGTPETATGGVESHQSRQAIGVRKSNGPQQGRDLLNGSKLPARSKLGRQDDGSMGTEDQSYHGLHEKNIASLQTSNGSIHNGQYVQAASLQKITAVSHSPAPDLKQLPSKRDTGKKGMDSDASGNPGFLRYEGSRQHDPGSRQGGDHPQALRSAPAMPFITGSKPVPAAPRNPETRQHYSKTSPAEPKVQIGQIDVVIEAPVQADKAPASPEATINLASRYYLRRL